MQKTSSEKQRMDRDGSGLSQGAGEAVDARQTAQERLFGVLVVRGLLLPEFWWTQPRKNANGLVRLLEKWIESGDPLPPPAMANTAAEVARKAAKIAGSVNALGVEGAGAEALALAAPLFMGGAATPREWAKKTLDEFAADWRRQSEAAERAGKKTLRDLEREEAKAVKNNETKRLLRTYAAAIAEQKQQIKDGPEGIKKKEARDLFSHQLVCKDLHGKKNNGIKTRALAELAEASRSPSFIARWPRVDVGQWSREKCETHLENIALTIGHFTEGPPLSWLGDPIATPMDRAIAALRLGCGERPLAEDVARWIAAETAASKKMNVLIVSELFALLIKNPEKARQFGQHLQARMRAPLQSAGEVPTIEDEFPLWSDSIPAEIDSLRFVGASQEDQSTAMAPASRRFAEKFKTAERQAMADGAVGELAIQAGRAYGLTAESGAELVGRARQALMSEAGWTAGVWRLAANNPEFAKHCAAAIALQAQNAKKAMAFAQRKEKMPPEAQSGAREKPSEKQYEKAERHREEARRFTLWLAEKEAAQNVALDARAMMAVGRAALVRGGDGESFWALSELISKARAPKGLDHEESEHEETLLWIKRRLGASAPEIGRFAEENVARALKEQRASEERADSWACAFAEGLGRSRPAGEACGAGARRGDCGKETLRRVSPERFDAFMRSVELLKDFEEDTPDFFAELPKKFNWGFLMNAQERWHEEQQRREFEGSNTADLCWEPVAEPFAEGEFTATPLANARALFEEGRAMHHCVFSYAEECHAGTERIVSIAKNGERVSTLELFPLDKNGSPMALDLNGENARKARAWRIGQNNGPCNAKAPQDAVAFSRRYVAKLAEWAAQRAAERAAAKKMAKGAKKRD